MTNDLQQFQVFAKPIGAYCNLSCSYCYYVGKSHLYPKTSKNIMSDEILEQYIIQHIEAASASTIVFSWHGGEPTLLGIDYFKRIIQLQKKNQPVNSHIINGIQTNGTLLNDEWARFLAKENFTVGVSIDGPEKIHDLYRRTPANQSTFSKTIRGIELLKKYNIFFEILCVVHTMNVEVPIQLYDFLKNIGAKYISFLPLAERRNGFIIPESVSSKKYGQFLCAIFDEWKANDIGEIKVQIFEEAARTAFEQEHSLCIFRKTCGAVPVIEHNGDFYTCDHFVNPAHLIGNIKTTSLITMLHSSQQIAFGEAKWDSLPGTCLNCEVLEMCNGGCPKNRFTKTPEGEDRLNYLCKGYKIFFNHIQPFVNEIKIAYLNQ